MKKSWSLSTIKDHWVKPTLLDFKDWMKETAEPHGLMEETLTKTKLQITITQQPSTKLPRKYLRQPHTRGTKKAIVVIIDANEIALRRLQG